MALVSSARRARAARKRSPVKVADLTNLPVKPVTADVIHSVAEVLGYTELHPEVVEKIVDISERVDAQDKQMLEFEEIVERVKGFTMDEVKRLIEMKKEETVSEIKETLHYVKLIQEEGAAVKHQLAGISEQQERHRRFLREAVMEHVQMVAADLRVQIQNLSQMVTVLTETALIEQGLSRQLFAEHQPNTDLMVLNSVNPPAKKDRGKSPRRVASGRRRTHSRAEGSKPQEEMTEMLNSTQKAFSSALRQKSVKAMRYQPTMPKFPSQMHGIHGGTMPVHHTQAEAQHDAQTKKLQDITAALALKQPCRPVVGKLPETPRDPSPAASLSHVHMPDLAIKQDAPQPLAALAQQIN